MTNIGATLSLLFTVIGGAIGILKFVRGDIKDLRADIDKRFEQVDKRFEQVDRRFEQVDRRFEQVDKRLDLMQSDIRTLSTQVNENLKVLIAHLEWHAKH
jgi:archaellum component FlaC